MMRPRGQAGMWLGQVLLSSGLGCGGGAGGVVWCHLWGVHLCPTSLVVGLVWRLAWALQSHRGWCLGLQDFSMWVWTMVNLWARSCTSSVTSPCILVMSSGPFHLAISFGETPFVGHPRKVFCGKSSPVANGCPLTLVSKVLFCCSAAWPLHMLPPAASVCAGRIPWWSVVGGWLACNGAVVGRLYPSWQQTHQGPKGLQGCWGLGGRLSMPNQCCSLLLGMKDEGCKCLTISCRTFCASFLAGMAVVVGTAGGGVGRSFRTSSWMAWARLSSTAGLAVASAGGVGMEVLPSQS